MITAFVWMVQSQYPEAFNLSEGGIYIGTVLLDASGMAYTFILLDQLIP